MAGCLQDLRRWSSVLLQVVQVSKNAGPYPLGGSEHFRAYAIPVFVRLADPQRRRGYPPILHGTTGFPPLPFRGSSAFTAHYI